MADVISQCLFNITSNGREPTSSNKIFSELREIWHVMNVKTSLVSRLAQVFYCGKEKRGKMLNDGDLTCNKY